MAASHLNVPLGRVEADRWRCRRYRGDQRWGENHRGQIADRDRKARVDRGRVERRQRGAGLDGSQTRRPPILSLVNARRAAIVLLDRCGEVAIAVAVLRAQKAESRGRYEEMASWRRIAEAAFASAFRSDVVSWKGSL